MKTFILVRGAPGSGKSTLIAQSRLAPFALSADAIRLALSGPMLDRAGRLSIRNDDSFNKRVLEVLRAALDDRLAQGQPIVLEGKFQKTTEIRDILGRAIDAGYRPMILDLYAIPEEIAQTRNAARDELRRVDPAIIADAYRIANGASNASETLAKALDQAGLADQVDIIDMDRFTAEHIDKAPRAPETMPFRRVVHIGDLQGVYGALFGHGRLACGTLTEKPVPHGLDAPDTAYVFVGDALDRGIENGEVMRWLIEIVTPRLGKNVFWIRGNHEDHLERWARAMPAVSREFSERTLPQLLDAEIDPRDVAAFLERTITHLHYSHGTGNERREVLVTHGGLPAIPSDLDLVATGQLMRGVGYHSDDIDRTFDAWAVDHPHALQFHGHRNTVGVAIDAYARSYNLEGGPDAGGAIRVAILEAGRVTPMELRNRRYRHPLEVKRINRHERRAAFGPELPEPAWMAATAPTA